MFVTRRAARAARQDPAPAHRVHLAAAAGAGKAVPHEQVPLAPEEVRGRHQPHAD